MKKIPILLLIVSFIAGNLFAQAPRKDRPNPILIQHTANHCLATISFQQIDKLIYLPVSINGSAEKSFILDCGASVWVIDPSVAQELNLKTDSAGIIHGAGTGTVPTTYARNIKFGLPGITTTVPKVTILDLSGAVPGHKVDGLLGYDFFKEFVVEINYPTNTMRLYAAKSYKYNGKGNVIPLIFKNKQVYVKGKIKLAGLPETMHEYLVDSGSSDEVNDELITKAKTKKSETVGGVGLGEKFKVTVGNIERLQIGSHIFKNIQGISGGQKIGSGLLHNYIVIFDYEHQQLILE